MDRSSLVRHAVSETVRVWRKGGTARTVLSHPKTGELVVGIIDQRGAAELIAWYLDCRRAEILQKGLDGEPLTREEGHLLKMFRRVPHRFCWIASPDGRHWILPRDAAYRPLTQPPEWLELADHPTTFDIGWHVPEISPSADEPASGVITVMGDLLTTWTRLKHLNDDKWRERRRCGIPDPPPIDDELASERARFVRGRRWLH